MVQNSMVHQSFPHELCSLGEPSPFGIAKKITSKIERCGIANDAFVDGAPVARVDGAVKLLCGSSKSLLSIHFKYLKYSKKEEIHHVLRLDSDIFRYPVFRVAQRTAKSSKKNPMSARLTAIIQNLCFMDMYRSNLVSPS